MAQPNNASTGETAQGAACRELTCVCHQGFDAAGLEHQERLQQLPDTLRLRTGRLILVQTCSNQSQHTIVA